MESAIRVCGHDVVEFFCFDDETGIESMGKASCAVNGNPPKIYDKEEYYILHDFIFNSRIQTNLPRLVYFTCSYPGQDHTL